MLAQLDLFLAVVLAVDASHGAVEVPKSSAPSTTTTAGSAVSRDVQVFVHGEAGYPCIRTPSIVRTSTGALLAFAGTRCGRGDGCEPTSPFNESFTHQDAVMKKSTDGGLTWSPLTVVHVANCSQHDHGAPGVLVRRNERRQWQSRGQAQRRYANHHTGKPCMRVCVVKRNRACGCIHEC